MKHKKESAISANPTPSLDKCPQDIIGQVVEQLLYNRNNAPPNPRELVNKIKTFNSLRQTCKTLNRQLLETPFGKQVKESNEKILENDNLRKYSNYPFYFRYDEKLFRVPLAIGLLSAITGIVMVCFNSEKTGLPGVQTGLYGLQAALYCILLAGCIGVPLGVLAETFTANRKRAFQPVFNALRAHLPNQQEDATFEPETPRL